MSRVALAVGIPLSVFVLVSLPLFLVNLSHFLSGVENTLVLLLVALLLWLHYQNRIVGRTWFAAVGTVLVLCYFSRLDSILLIAVYLPWLLVRHFAEQRVYAVACCILVGSAVLAHWAVMYAFFDTIFPTSQIAIKRFWAPREYTTLLEAFAPYYHFLSVRAREIAAVSGWSLAQIAPTVDRYIGLLVPLTSIAALVPIARRDLRRRWPIPLVGLGYVLQLVYYAVEMFGWIPNHPRVIPKK